MAIEHVQGTGNPVGDEHVPLFMEGVKAEPRPVTRLRRFGNACLATAMFMLPVACSDEGTSSAKGCVEPTQSDIAAVDDLLEIAPGEDSKPPVTNNMTIAAKYGLTIHSFNYGAIASDATFGEGKTFQLPFDQYYNAAQGFLNLYGIRLEIGSEYLPKDAKPLTEEDLHNNTAKAMMLFLIRSIAEQPVELVKQYAGLDNVVLVDLPGTLGGRVYSSRPRSFFIDPNLSNNKDTYLHELYHLIDWQQCGVNASVTDKSYAVLSPPDLYNNPGKYFSYTTIRDLCLKRYLTRIADDIAAHDEANKELQQVAPKVVAYSDYGKTEAVEDKADLGAEMLNPASHAIFRDNNFPILDGKFRFLFARLYHDNPQIARYLIDVGSSTSAQC